MKAPVMPMETMRACYDRQPLVAVESVARQYQTVEVDAHRNLVNVLSYLEHTRRYKENKTFARASFETYLQTRWNLPYRTYQESKTAYLRHPEMTERYGIGVVVNALRRCGLDRLPDLELAIEDAEITSGAPLDLEDLEALVLAFTKPVAKRAVVDWKAKYLALEEETQALRAEMDAKDAEIARLKDAVVAAHTANVVSATTKVTAKAIFDNSPRGRRLQRFQAATM